MSVIGKFLSLHPPGYFLLSVALSLSCVALIAIQTTIKCLTPAQPRRAIEFDESVFASNAVAVL